MLPLWRMWRFAKKMMLPFEREEACVHARTFTALMRPLPLRLLAFTRLPLVPESL